jgi:hypothetical protein
VDSRNPTETHRPVKIYGAFPQSAGEPDVDHADGRHRGGRNMWKVSGVNGRP